MVANIQFIQVTPEQLQNAILTGVKEQFSEFAKQFEPKTPTEYLTRNEVKELFKVDLSTVHNWTKKGKIKSYGIGARVYYKRHEVEAILTPLNA